VVSMLGYSL